MLPARAGAPLTGEAWVYEPAHDGVRALVAVEPGRGRAGVRIFSSAGKDETARYPGIVSALGDFARRLKAPVLADGEIVGDAFVAFDLLRDGDRDLRPLPLATRRAHLERALGNVGSRAVRLSEFHAGDGRSLYRRAQAEGGEAIVARRLDSRYRSGRSADWRRMKVEPRRRAPAPAGPTRAAAEPDVPLPPALATLVERIAALEAAGGGTLELPDGGALDVSHLDRVFWPGPGATKGALMRYYVRVAPVLLAAIADRPLVMQRFPYGVGRRAFYQQHAPEAAPAGVRIATLPGDRAVPSRLVGGDLLTLLYMVNIAVIAQDPWFSRVASPGAPDHAVLDLDPMPGVPFGRVRDAALWIRDELVRLGIPSFPKTSGASGLHVYVPLPAGTTYETARIFCQIVATRVAARHPRQTTVERALHARGRRVYLDHLQNSRGKTLAAAYSARATRDAGVSTPLRWAEVDGGADRGDFTIFTVPRRLRQTGDLWAGLRQSAGADLAAVLRDAA